MNITELIGGGCGGGGYVLDEKEWVVRDFEGIGKVKFRNRNESNMGGFFPGQLLYGVTETGLLISIRVGEEGRLVPPRLPGEIE